MIYFCFTIPVIATIILAVFYKKYVIWWELLVPIGISVIFILIAKAICIHSLTTDVEYLGGWVSEVRYYEDWNEYIHRTCQSCSGSGKTRSCVTYDCSYVRYHAEYWTAETTLGQYNISEQRYNQLVNKFKQKPSFYDMHRRYHTNDGDMYFAKWQGENETLESVTATHNYENRPKAALNVFHYEPVDSIDIKQYKPFNYPPITDKWHQVNILGYKNPEAERKLQILNARLGKSKQIRVFFCIFKNQPLEAAHIQEQYWEGSNKNEFIVCVGIDDKDKVQWAYDFSWTEREDMKVDVRTYAQSQDTLNLSSLVDYTYNEIETKWKRRDFKEFDYLSIEPTMKQVVWILILTTIICIGIGVWVVKNDID